MKFTLILICGIILTSCTTYNITSIEGSYNDAVIVRPPLQVRNPDYPK